MQRRIYKNPPIQEALCEFYYQPFSAWDPDRIARLYGRIKGTFDGQPVQELVPQNMLSSEGELNQITGFPVPRSRFTDASGRLVLMVGQGAISIHVLRPYKGWHEEFQPLVSDALTAFDEEAGGLDYKHIGVRYINSIEFKVEAEIALQEYFSAPPQIPDGISRTTLATLDQTTVLYEQEQAVMTLSFAANVKGDALAVLLDIVVNNQPAHESLQLSAALDRIDRLRTLEREAFEACITDALRRKFDE